MTRYTVAVRALCEFTAKAGDLDLRFTPSPSAQQGMAGHTLVTSRRPDSYQTEVPLQGEYGRLQVRGRADGYDPARNQLEEIKTFRGNLTLQPANHRHLHWAQVKIYGWLLCQQLDLAEVTLALVYLDIGSQKETVFSERFVADDLQTFFAQQCERFLAWSDQELAHRDARDTGLTRLRFPHATFRQGQRELAETVYKAVCTGNDVLMQATTGIGKTVGTLFPLLKAMPARQLDRAFFLTAKTPGRGLALHALHTLVDSAPALPLRVLELTARDKTCEHPDKACHGDSCPLAKGFYDRLPDARQAAQAVQYLDQAALRSVAAAHQVCPYYLGQEMARWCDVVVGDYNYYFDLNAMLYGMTAANQWRIGVLVDEAHNLVERSRRMYTAELSEAGLKSLRRTAPTALKKCLDKTQRCWRALLQRQDSAYQVHAELPEKLLKALQEAIATIGDYQAEHPANIDPALLTWYFEAIHFCRIADLFSSHSLFDITRQDTPRKRLGTSVLCLRNVVPGPLLQPRFEAAQATVLFSATLNPAPFYRDLLGLSPGTPWLEVTSPFRPEQLSIHIVDTISTRFARRADSAGPIAALIADQFTRCPGNYLAFFSSFDYLLQVAGALRGLQPDIPLHLQDRRMGETERVAFLDRFSATSRGIGFAVLGGAFGEGIDLPGDRLIGAFIVTLGLPQINPVNEQMKLRMELIFGAGYDYTYFFPGLQKVVQAAGRVIRTEQDKGTLFLIDDRFSQQKVKQLLPGWWGLPGRPAS